MQIKDRLSFQSFLGLRLGDEVPDGNTIWDFKELLEENEREGSRKLFEAFHQILTLEGLIAKEGSIVDAKSKLIDKAVTTPANVHDSPVFPDLVDESDQAVLADSAYYSAAHEEYLLECNAEEFLMRKGNRNSPLSESEQQTNKGMSRIRVRVEHVFGRMKQLGMDIVRSIGLKRATAHNHLSNLVYNLDRDAFLKS